MIASLSSDGDTCQDKPRDKTLQGWMKYFVTNCHNVIDTGTNFETKQ